MTGGFTLVEVLAVVVILGLLATVLINNFSGGVGKGRHELAKTAVGILTQRIELYVLEHGEPPAMHIGLTALSDASPESPYFAIKEQLVDPWKRPYVFITPGPDGHLYEIVSYGRDGQPGGDAEDADVSSVSLGS